MKPHTEDTSNHDDIELIELGAVSEETRGNFEALDEGGEFPFTRQVI